MAFCFVGAKFQGFDDSGAPLSGGKVYTYAAGTTTPLASYTTQAGDVANANPVILDAAGRADIWLGAAAYRLVVKTSAGVTISDTDNYRGGPDSTADYDILRAKRFVVGYDDDADITDNSSLTYTSLLNRYSTAYSNKTTRSGMQIQRFIMADTGNSINTGLKITTILGAEDGATTPVLGDYRSQWDLNVEHDNYSNFDDGSVSVGGSFTVRRYGAQGTMGIHLNVMHMQVPATANDPNIGGITGMEGHSDAIGPDNRASGGTGYGYRQTIRLTARTQSTMPTWGVRGTGAFSNSTAVSRDDICFSKDAVVTEEYGGPYWVCVTAGTTGVVDTILDGIDTALTQVVDGTAVWECRRGAEIGVALKILNGTASAAGPDGNGSVPGYYRYGIIIDSDQNGTSPNEIAHAIYVKNSGEKNFQSYGDPDYHAHMYGIAEPALLVLGSADAVAGTNVGALQFKGDSSTGAERLYASVTGQSIDNTEGSTDGRLILAATVAAVGEPHVYLESLNTIIGDKAILATTATDGFLHIGRCAGAPTGVPTLYTGKCPMVVDSTNGRLYVYHTGAWHYATLT